MVLAGHSESGAEEWLCPACGRRMLLRWPPHFDALVLENGDPAAVHTAAKGGALMHRAEVVHLPPAGVPADEQEWLRSNGIDWDGIAS
jgi:hypothetical protein